MKFADTRLTDHRLVIKAFDLADKSHAGQKRWTAYHEETAPQYMTHPVKVAEILQDTIDDYNPALIAAALSHDTLEDTDLTEAELRAALGDEVTEIVKEVTLDPELKGKARRDFQSTSISDYSLNGRRTKVADRTANLYSLAFDPPAHWTLNNRAQYLESSIQLINNANIPDHGLREVAEHAVKLAKRALRVAVRERLEEKGPAKRHWKDAYNPLMQEMLALAKQDIEDGDALIDKDGAPIQRTDDIDELYLDAVEAQRELREVLTGLKDFKGDGIEIVIPNKLKERGRADEVIQTRYQGDAKKINDLARASVICKTPEQVDEVLHALSHSYKIEQLYDRINNPPMSAYRDMRLVLRSDNNHFCEVQLHLEHFWYAKKHKGDDLYAEARQICGKTKEEMTPEDKKRRRAIYSESRELYKEAGRKHGYEESPVVDKCPPQTFAEYVAAQQEQPEIQA